MGNSADAARDFWLPVLALAFMGTTLLGSLAGAIYLDAIGREVPPWLATLIGTLGGSFGTIVIAFVRSQPGNGNGTLSPPNK